MKGPWTIETACLGMRTFNAGDASELRIALADDEFVNAVRANLAESGRTEQIMQHWLRGNVADPWAVVLKDTGQLVGVFGLLRDPDAGKGVVKTAFVVRDQAFEQGYANEAVQAASAFIRKEIIANGSDAFKSWRTEVREGGYNLQGSIVKRWKGVSVLSFTFSLK